MSKGIGLLLRKGPAENYKSCAGRTRSFDDVMCRCTSFILQLRQELSDILVLAVCPTVLAATERESEMPTARFNDSVSATHV